MTAKKVAPKPRGGKRAGAGRKPGEPNKVKRELAALAQQYTEEALQTWVTIMRDNDATNSERMAAAEKIIDRGHGKAPQGVQLSTDPEKPLIVRIEGSDKGLL